MTKRAYTQAPKITFNCILHNQILFNRFIDNFSNSLKFISCLDEELLKSPNKGTKSSSIILSVIKIYYITYSMKAIKDMNPGIETYPEEMIG